jgi:hypothetical protein
VRTRAQMALLMDIERREEELMEMVQRYLTRYA